MNKSLRTTDETSSKPFIDLSNYHTGDYNPGRGLVTRLLWYYTSLCFFENGWLPCKRLKRTLLRLFGAKVGRGVVIKPHVRIKFPWRLELGDHCWIGQEVWIDNLAEVKIGEHTCLSQGVYLCTGSHQYRERSFDLVTRPITIGAGTWLTTRVTILPGVTVGANLVIPAGTVVNRNLPEVDAQ